MRARGTAARAPAGPRARAFRCPAREIPTLDRAFAQELAADEADAVGEHAHATRTNQVRVVAGVGRRSHVMQKNRRIAQSVVAQSIDLGFGQRVHLADRVDQLRDLADVQCLVGQATLLVVVCKVLWTDNFCSVRMFLYYDSTS
jgi:hypothetical protein